MKRIKIALFSLICIGLAGVFGAEYVGNSMRSIASGENAALVSSEVWQPGVVSKREATNTTSDIIAMNNVLTVRQSINTTATEWEKLGANQNLSATATKVATNSLTELYRALDDADANGNAKLKNSQAGNDDYVNAPVYKDIDLVNVSVSTGELIGKLSNINYPFEWFGGTVSLPAGTVLASGRTLAVDEKFTVDVYTYYPTMYIRRWIDDGAQYISITDEANAQSTGFDAVSVKVPEFYTATFEATLFNPDKTVARNTKGIYPRSYVHAHGPLTYSSAAYLVSYYGYSTYSGYGASAMQTNMLMWSSNLTKAWAESGLSSEYRKVTGVQGENYTAFVYNLLYLVKYAHNNSQEQVGQGNVYTYSIYNASGVTVKSANGTTITTGGNSTNSYLEAEKGGGTIGVVKAAEAGTATYDAENNYKLSATGYDAAGMNYGYNSEYKYMNDLQGLWAQQFLVFNTGTKRYLRDGFVGSNGYTSVFCLGQCNAWGNVWTWVFGTAVAYDDTTDTLHLLASFEDYNCDAPNWYIVANDSGAYSTKLSAMQSGNYNYYEMSYALPRSNNYYRYFGVSDTSGLAGSNTTNSLAQLVGLPTSASSSASTGLCDYYYQNSTISSTFGVLRGGRVNDSTRAGAFNFYVNYILADSYMYIGFRPALIPATT